MLLSHSPGRATRALRGTSRPLTGSRLGVAVGGGERDSAGLRGRASRSRRGWRCRWPRRWVPWRGWAGSRGSSRDGLTMAAFACSGPTLLLRARKELQPLARKKMAACANRRGSTRKKFTAELSRVIVAASSRTAARKAAAHSERSSLHWRSRRFPLRSRDRAEKFW